MTVIIFQWMRVAHDVECTVHFCGIPPSTEKLLLRFPYHLIFDVLKRLKFNLTLTLLTTYFRFGGWRYTLFVLTNQNHCYMSKLND